MLISFEFQIQIDIKPIFELDKSQMSESYRKMSQKPSSTSSIGNINININVSMDKKSNHNKNKKSEVNGKKIGKIPSMSLHPSSQQYRPIVSTDTLTRSKRMFEKQIKNQENYLKSCYQYEEQDQYLETFAVQDQVQFQKLDNKRIANQTKIVKSKMKDNANSNSNKNRKKIMTNNSKAISTQKNSYQKQQTSTQKKTKHQKSKSKSHSKSKSKSHSKSKYFKTSLSPGKTLSSRSKQVKSFGLSKSKYQDFSKSISISKQLEKAIHGISTRIKDLSISPNFRKNKKRSSSKSKSKSKSKQNIKKQKNLKSRSKQKSKNKSTEKRRHKQNNFHEYNNQCQHRKQQIKNNKSSNLKSNKNIQKPSKSTTNFYNPHQKFKSSNTISHHKISKKTTLESKQISKKKQSPNKKHKEFKQSRKQYPKLSEFQLKNHQSEILPLQRYFQYIDQIITIQRIFRGYRVRKQIGTDLDQISARIKYVKQSISHKQSRYWQNEGSQTNSIQNMENHLHQILKLPVNFKRKTQNSLQSSRSSKFTEKKNFQNISPGNSISQVQLPKSNFTKQKSKNIPLSQESQLLKKLLEQNQKLKQKIRSIQSAQKSYSSQHSHKAVHFHPGVYNLREDPYPSKELRFSDLKQSQMEIWPTYMSNKSNKSSSKSHKSNQSNNRSKPQSPKQQKNIQQIKVENQKPLDVKYQRSSKNSIQQLSDLSPVIKTEQSQIDIPNFGLSSEKKNTSNKKPNIILQENILQQNQNTENLNKQLKKKFQFYECSPRNADVNSMFGKVTSQQIKQEQYRNSRYQILDQEYHRKIKLLQQVKRDNILSPKSCDFKVRDLLSKYKKQKKQLQDQLNGDTFQNHPLATTPKVQKDQIQSQRKLQKIVQKSIQGEISLSIEKQGEIKQIQKSQQFPHISTQFKTEPQDKIEGQRSFEIQQQKLKIDSQQDDQVNEDKYFNFQQFQEQYEIKNNQNLEDNESKQFVKSGSAQKMVKINQIINQQDTYKDTINDDILPIARQSSPSNSQENSQIITKQNYDKTEPVRGFQTNLLFVKNFIFSFFDYLRNFPQFQKSIATNLLSSGFHKGHLLTCYRTQLCDIDDTYQDKPQGHYLAYPYWKNLIDYDPIISAQIFQKFNFHIQKVASETNNQDGFVIDEQSQKAFQQKFNSSLSQQQKIFIMFLMDVINQAMQMQRFGQGVSESITLKRSNLANYYPLKKSLYLINKVIQNPFGAEDPNLEEIKRQKQQLMDTIICNVLKRILQNWGRCLCGLIIEPEQQDQMGITQQQIAIKNQQRLQIFLQKFLFDYEKEIDDSVKEHQVCSKLLVADQILQQLVNQCTSQCILLEQQQ